jgi:hypothetical protein
MNDFKAKRQVWRNPSVRTTPGKFFGNSLGKFTSGSRIFAPWGRSRRACDYGTFGSRGGRVMMSSKSELDCFSNVGRQMQFASGDGARTATLISRISRVAIVLCLSAPHMKETGT